MAVSMLLLNCLHVTLISFFLRGDCFQMEYDPCDSSCAGFPSADVSYQRGVRYTYRYSTAISTTLHGSSSGRNGLALDCVVDIDPISKCHLILQIRNSQIKRLSPQKEHSVQRLKSLRESLERMRLKFSLQGGKVTALCPQEGEQVWALNIKRALLSMLQTSRTAYDQHVEKESDVYGTCTSRYERRGPILLKTRDLKQCYQDRLADFWPHSVIMTEDTTVDSKVQCAQRHRMSVMEEVNCTEAVSAVMLSGAAGLLKTQTVSRLTLLRVQPGTPSELDSLGTVGRTDLHFEEERAARPGKVTVSSRQQASQIVGMLCLTSDQQQISLQLLQLVFQLRELSLSQLKTLWLESSFKCRNDWQPLLDALLACGSENCLLLLTDLMRNLELEMDQALSYLTTMALIPRPSPQIIASINALLEIPGLRHKALLTGSSLVHLLCQKSSLSCISLPQVQTFIQALEETLAGSCQTEDPTRVTELFYALKSVGNSGAFTPGLVSLVNRCAIGESTPMELRLAAVQAFRRIPCSVDRSLLLQLYRSSQEDPEVRIAAYQQLMRCPGPHVLRVVKTTLRNETSSQVGSFVWSHLTHVMRSEDPMKQALIESLPDDIISRDFEAEFWKYSSYSDYTVGSGMGVANLEGTLVFSPKSFLPRSAMANLTVYFHGRAHNLLEVDLRVENAEPLLKNLFGQESTTSEREPTGGSGGHREPEERKRRRRKREDVAHRGGKESCSSSASSVLNQARAMLSWRRKTEEDKPRCWVGVKVFGNEISAFTCDDLHTQMNQLSLNMAGLTIKLLKGQEVQLNHMAVPMTEDLVLPSLSGMPIRIAVNVTSLLSVRLKGNANYRDASHFSLAGYIKPSAYVSLSLWMGVDGALGQAGVEWLSELTSSTSLDGSIQLQERQDLRATLNTPEDLMDIASLSSRVFQVNGDNREEIKGPKSHIERTICTPKSWSKMVGWQLCSNVSYPLAVGGISLPPPGPVYLSLRLLKLDRGLHYYLLEAAYSLLTQSGSWFPRDASLHLLLATPLSSIPRDMSLDVALNPHRLLLKVTHPLKSIHLQGQLSQERNVKSGKLELSVDNVHHYYIMGLVDTQTLLSEQRMRYHLEAKTATSGHPMILSANITRGMGRKTSFAATVKNVFRETASIIVSLERRLDDNNRQYSLEAELLLPGVVGSRILGLMEHKGSLWSSALRLKYGLGDEARHLRQECHMSESLRSGRDPNLTYTMRAEHEFYCSNTLAINHKIRLRHEESPSHSRSTLEMSYGKHWDEINNKHTLLLSQAFRNQSTQNHTSYTLEIGLQVPEKHLNYRTQLLHSHLRTHGSESSTHLKVNYNDGMPLVAGLHWKSTPEDALEKTREGTFNMDTPWLYIFTAHKLSQIHSHTLQLSSELTARKWLTIRNLVLEGLYRDRGREKEARLDVYTPAITYLKAGGWGIVGKHGVKASCSLSSLWSAPLRGNLSLEASKYSHTLQMASSYDKHNISLSAALNTIDKNLKKRQVLIKMAMSEPKTPATELELEGAVEELRKDQRMYQKTAMLRLRQPFQNLPQTLVIRETFTVDLLKGLYILESRAGVHGNQEVIHTLTIGYKSPSHFVCSALTHPFNSNTIPSDSEICVTISSNQTQREIQGRLRIGSKNRASLYGQLLFHPPKSGRNGVRVKANITHLLQLHFPSSAIVEGEACWTPQNNTKFDYLARGRMRIERQECQFSLHLNGTSERFGLHSSLSHPFKSKIPKTMAVHATAERLVAGRGRSSIRVTADGKEQVLLDAQLSNVLRRGNRAMGVSLNLSQSLLPTATDLHLKMAANVSSDSVSLHSYYNQGERSLLAQVRGSLNRERGLQLAVSGDLRHSLSSLAALPATLGLEGALGHTGTLTEGQLRVRVMEALYSVELKHQEEGPGEFWEGANRYWLCARSGEEYLFANASCRLGGRGRGGVFANLTHSSHLLSTTGLPGNSSVQVSWAQEGGRTSLLAELLAQDENMTAEVSWDRRLRPVPRWEVFSKAQHRSKTLTQRGLPSQVQARAHFQMEAEGVKAGVSLDAEQERMLGVTFDVGANNSTAHLAVSLRQQMRQLTGVLPTSLQMNCAGDATADRLSGHCVGSASGHPVEVRAFRSYRPHSRLCCGLALAHISLSANAKGCYSPAGQAEFRAHLAHSSRRLATSLGLPANASLRFAARPGPPRWGLGIRLAVGPWRLDSNAGLKLEAAGVYGWHALVDYGTPGVGQHGAGVRGRTRVESWCRVWADVSGAWGPVRSSLLVSTRCGGLGRLTWRQVRDSGQGRAPRRTSLTLQAGAGGDGLKGSLDLENHRDSLQCLLWLLLKERQAELAWTLQHQWASLASAVPKRVDVKGSGRLHNTSLSGSVWVFLDSRSAQLDITAAWAPSISAGVKLQHSSAKLAAAGVPEALAVSAQVASRRMQLEVDSTACSVLLSGSLLGSGGEHRRTGWGVSVRQRCVLLETAFPSQFSVNGSFVHSGCNALVGAHLQAGGRQKGSLSLSMACRPDFVLQGSIQHSIEALQLLGVPTHGALGVSAARLPALQLSVELGQCYVRATTGETQIDQSSYAVNVSHYCPALQGTILPVSLVLQGVLSAVPCQLGVSSTLRVDGHNLTLALGQTCGPPGRLSGTLAHSFPGLITRGLPARTTIEASAPPVGGSPRTGALLIRVGDCRIGGQAATEAGGDTRWLWAVESDCPFLQGHVNGSVGHNALGTWTAVVATGLSGRGALLRLSARASPGLVLEGQLTHNLTALGDLPAHSRLLVTSRAGAQGRDTEALLHVGDCAVRATGAVMASHGLQGSVVYHDNCTMLQEWGIPTRVQASGSMVASQTALISKVSIAIDNGEFLGLITMTKTKDRNEASVHFNHSVPLLKRAGLPANAAVAVSAGNHGNGFHQYSLSCSAGNQQLIEDITVTKTFEVVKVENIFRHTMDYLQTLGVPDNNSVQIEFSAGEWKTLELSCQYGVERAGLRLLLKSLPVTTELRGTVWHRWSSLQERGLPLITEGMCSIGGTLPQLQSKAQLVMDGHKLAVTGLNISAADGHLAFLLSVHPAAFSLTHRLPSVDAALSAQFTGPLRSLAADVRLRDCRLRLVGDVGGWGTPGGSREARVTLKHMLQAQTIPVLQVEAWGRLTDSQLRCSVAVNPELSASLALIIQGHYLPESKELMLKVVQNVPQLLVYLPVQLNARSQFNQSRSSMGGMVELASGRRKLWALGELVVTESGYRQALELNHTYTQLKPLPRAVAIRTVYETGNWSHWLQHGAVWGNQEFSLAALYASPPALDLGNRTLKIQITSAPRRSRFEVNLERSLHARLDSVLMGWTRHGRVERVTAVSLWRGSADKSEAVVELKQPFTPALSRVSLRSSSHAPRAQPSSSHETHLSWETRATPVNVSFTLIKQWPDSSSRGQACALFSSGQTVVSSLKGCVSVAQEGNSYSQNAELQWDSQSVKQAMKYQRGPKGVHTFQINVGLENPSLAPCTSHSLLAKVQTNLRDRLEHTVLLGLCPPQPGLSWSGSHRVNSGEELFFTQTHLSVTGRPHQCTLTLALTNSSSAYTTNISLFTEARFANWSVEVGASALSSVHRSRLQLQATLDSMENIWLKGAIESGCLLSTAGYMSGQGPAEELTLAACLEASRRWSLALQRQEGRARPEAIGTVSMGTTKQSLTLSAQGCSDSLFAVEERVQHLSSHIRSKLSERVKTLQQLFTEVRHQARDSPLLQELSSAALLLAQRAGAPLGQRDRGPWALWRSSRLRHALTDGLPGFLSALQRASQLGRQELRRPLVTLAGVYRDVSGQRLEVLWREALSAWTSRLVEAVPPLLKNPHLRPLAQASLAAALDVAGQQSAHWAETKLAAALTGVRKRLASIYKLSPSECSVSVSVPLPWVPWSRVLESGLVEVLLEEWLLRPLRALTSLRPTAELYHLKKKIMDSPFMYQALLVADQFVVSFDGNVYELPGSCSMLLAQDVSRDSFTLLLNADSQSQRSLVVGMNNNTFSIHKNGQVKASCHATHTSDKDTTVAVNRGSNIVEVSNLNGVSVSCDLSLSLCSFTLDGWWHGKSTGLLGTNDNEAGNDFPLPDGSQAGNMLDFFHSWQMQPECMTSPAKEPCSKLPVGPVSCHFLFSSPDSPLSSCFRVVDPGQFLSVCKTSLCGAGPSPSRPPCRLAAAYVHICLWSYVPLELPVQCSGVLRM